jgi:hypothetical protein
MSPHAYRRLIRAGAVLGAIASIYAFLTLEVFSGLLSPASGRLSPVFKVMEARDEVDFGFVSLNETPITELNATFGTYTSDGRLLHPDYFIPKEMTVDPKGEKVALARLSEITANRAGDATIYFFCADFKAASPLARIREVYLLTPGKNDPSVSWGQTLYLREVWRLGRPDCTPPDQLPPDWLETTRL